MCRGWPEDYLQSSTATVSGLFIPNQYVLSWKFERTLSSHLPKKEKKTRSFGFHTKRSIHSNFSLFIININFELPIFTFGAEEYILQPRDSQQSIFLHSLSDLYLPHDFSWPFVTQRGAAVSYVGGTAGRLSNFLCGDSAAYRSLHPQSARRYPDGANRWRQ